MAPNEHVPGTRFRFIQGYQFAPIVTRFPQFLRLSNEDVNRWKRASDFISVYGDTYLYMGASKHELVDVEGRRAEECIERRIRNWPDIYDILEDTVTAMAFTAAAFVYGGLHTLAWFANFRTPTEQTLWRLSACVVMAGNPVILIFSKISDESARWDRRNSRLLRGKEPFHVLGDISADLMILTLLAYTLARAYLVVECFVSLTHLPAGAFDVPDWAAYFPHI